MGLAQCGDLGGGQGQGLLRKERVEGAAEVGEPHRRGAGNP